MKPKKFKVGEYYKLTKAAYNNPIMVDTCRTCGGVLLLTRRQEWGGCHVISKYWEDTVNAAWGHDPSGRIDALAAGLCVYDQYLRKATQQEVMIAKACGQLPQLPKVAPYPPATPQHQPAYQRII